MEKVFQHSIAKELCLLFCCEARTGKLWSTVHCAKLMLHIARHKNYFIQNLGQLQFDTLKVNPSFWVLNPIALRKAKIVYNFGLSECSRVKGYMNLTLQVSWSDISGRG